MTKTVEEAQNWTAEKQKSGWVLIYDRTPNGVKNEDGTTSFSLRFPALVLTDWISEPEIAAKELATQLNAYDGLLEALKALLELTDDPHNDAAPEESAFTFARAAIEKAEGRRL
jgi:hypothetical protein